MFQQLLAGRRRNGAAIAPCQALIVGCARSGTSILGELIAAHPSVKYLFEATKLWESIRMRADGSHRLCEADACERVRRQLRDSFLRLRQNVGPDAFVVEKSPRNTLRIPFLRRVFPEAKIIHIVRDGRDVACSLLPGLATDRWRHLKPPDWRHIEASHQGVARCAMAWQSILRIALDDLRDVPHLQVRYENLVRDPVGTAVRVLNFLGLEDDGSVFEFAGLIQNETADSYHARYQSEWYRDNHCRRVGRWQENLTAEQQRDVTALIAPMLGRLGYE